MSFPAGKVELSVNNTGLFWQVGEEKVYAAEGTDSPITTCWVTEFLQDFLLRTESVTL
jgi:hypothetical protein